MRRTETAKRRLLVDGFDELNVLKTVKALYEALDADARERFSELYVMTYMDTLRRFGKKPPKREDAELLADLYLAGMLAEPDPVTKFAWDAETLRKRDRAAEAVNAVPTKALKQIELDKAVKLWSKQAQQYADTVTYDAVLGAYRDAGVKRVRWVCTKDEKVCRTCRDLNGSIFPIDEVPEKAHWRCRCSLEPV